MRPSWLGAGLALLLATPTLAAPTLAAEPGTVTTRATARDRLPNTVADVTLQIEAQARTLAEVQTALTTNSASLMAYLQSAGTARTRTQGVGVQPQVDQNPARGQAPRVVGYAGQVSVAFQVDADKLGAVLANALTHGANSVQDTTLHPRQQEMDAKRQSLATQATRQALDEARAVAEAAGRHLGAARSLNVDSAYPNPARSFNMLAAPAPAAPSAMAAPVATAAGDTEITATVTVTMALTEP